MGYDYEEELARAREIRRRQKLEREQAAAEEAGTRSSSGDSSDGSSGTERVPAENRVRESRARKVYAGEHTVSGSSAGGEAPGERRTDRAGDGRRPKKNKKRRRIITMIVAEVFALLLIFVYAYAYKLYNVPQRPKFESDVIKNQAISLEDLQKMEDYWMIAVFGVDSRGKNVGAGTNADVSIICCINQKTGDIKLVSVFRDTYLNIDDEGSYNKINMAYAKGGPEQAVQALNRNLDLDITDYITFNWKAVADAINILGGVDLEISKAEFKYINSFITETVKSTGIGSNHLKKAGMNHLDGVQAVAYGRLRLMDTDFARTERQRKIIQLAFDKAKVADYSVLNNILVVVLPQVATSLDFGDLTNVALNIMKYKLGETAGFPEQRGDANMKKKGAVVVPATLESNAKRLHQFLFTNEEYTPSDTLLRISEKIQSDTGIYKEGQVISQVGTKGSIPKETTAPKVEETAEKETTEEATAEEAETDADGNPISSTEESTIRYPGIGETDADGNLVDGPEEPGDLELPGSNTPGNPTRPGTTLPSNTPGDVPGQNPGQTPGFNEGNTPGNPTGPGTTPQTSPARPDSTRPSEDVPGPGIGPGEPTGADRPSGPADIPNESSAPTRPNDLMAPPTVNNPGGGPNNGPGDNVNNNGPGMQ